MKLVRLYHGTDLASANSLLSHGVDAASARRYNGGGEFWATANAATADVFARANPAGGVPARFEFDLPEQVLLQMLGVRPKVAYDYPPDDYEFLPPCFTMLNQHMTNKRVVRVP